MAVVLVPGLVFVSFVVSAAGGLGGSLVLVPTLAIVLGPKEGVALAALLLAGNNVFKVGAYRRTLPFQAAAGIIVLLVVGAAVGSVLLVAAPAALISGAIIVMLLASWVIERAGIKYIRSLSWPFLAFFSGATSGLSGTSGPLKGAAIRNLNLDRHHFVGAASLAALAGDATKTVIFAQTSLLGISSFLILLATVPLMAVGTWCGRGLNERLGERSFATLFWVIMGGYSARLVALGFF